MSSDETAAATDQSAPGGGRRKRQRPRRRGKGGGQKPGNGKGSKPKKASATPSQLIKSAARSSGTQEKVFAEKPLSAEEVSDLKRHFRFLREHKKELKLKLNATEDLLLNGTRPPEHRGVCQHLLATRV